MKRLNKNGNFNQGNYTPQFRNKYKGSWPILYRSSLELKVFRHLDLNSHVISWGSESVVIPYRSPLDLTGKLHRYFVDVVAHLQRKDGSITKLLIEIKPEKYTLPPTITPNKSKKTLLYEHTQYAINMAKWEAARKWCERNGYTFFILTEKKINQLLNF
jgi:hypothetical protein